MAWSFSLLPAYLNIVEVWLVRVFLFLGLIIIGPWAVLIVYDIFLYLWRSALHEIPFVGGRARGRARPRAPSLSERPSGRPRTFSLSVSPGRGQQGMDTATSSAIHQRRSSDMKKRYEDTFDENE